MIRIFDKNGTACVLIRLCLVDTIGFQKNLMDLVIDFARTDAVFFDEKKERCLLLKFEYTNVSKRQKSFESVILSSRISNDGITKFSRVRFSEFSCVYLLKNNRKGNRHLLGIIVKILFRQT